MRTLVFVCAIAICLAIQPKGTIERIYSEDGLEKFYTETFMLANLTFKEDLGTHSEYTGWWIFGSEATIYNTHITNIDFGKISTGTFDTPTMKYVFRGGPFSADFEYSWEYRFFIFPFTHQAQCQVSFPTFTVTATFKQDGDAVSTDLHIEIPFDSLKFSCIDDEKTQGSRGYQWMTEVRNGYRQEF